MRAVHAVVILGSMLVSTSVRARCPNIDDVADPACEPHVSMLMPSAYGVLYAPNGRPYIGGGAEFALFSWANSNDSFGPSHGKIRIDVAYLGGENKRRMVLYGLGAVVSFEGNPGRRFLIPYYGASFGALWESQLKSRALFDASLGLFLIHTRSFVLEANGGVVLPLSAVDALIGPKAQLTASFALW